MTLAVKRLDATEAGFAEALDELLHWDVGADDEVGRVAAEIVDDVRRRGDRAVMELTARLDGWTPRSPADWQLDPDTFREAYRGLADAEREALGAAAARIDAYHRRQLDGSWEFSDADGNRLGQRVTPLDRVGVYVPGGQAAYPSTVLMTAIPARVAGVGEVVMTVPTPGGARNPLVLAAAHVAGVGRGFTIGGAQAVAALAFGTASVPRVDKIVGPGGAFVAAAKRLVFGAVGIDVIAGPSEVAIIADGSAPVDWMVLDLFSQAEHDAAAQAILLSPDSAYLDAVAEAMSRLLGHDPAPTSFAPHWKGGGR